MTRPRLRALVIDDEELACERVCELVGASPALELVGRAADGAEALDRIEEARPDVIFLDIQMPELDGFQVIGALAEDVIPAVVFVTAYDAYAIRAFEVGAFDYLLKPITRERFEGAVARLLERAPSADETVRVRDLARRVERERGWARRLVARRGLSHYFVPVSEIEWIEADGNYLRIEAAGRSHLVRRTMKDAEGRLDSAHFVRIHRSTIVAIDRIASIRTGGQGEYVVTMHGGKELASSRSYHAAVRRLLR